MFAVTVEIVSEGVPFDPKPPETPQRKFKFPGVFWEVSSVQPSAKAEIEEIEVLITWKLRTHKDSF